MFWQGVVNGFSAGWIYVLVALGLTLVFIMRTVQFAHGEVYMLGAHVVFFACVSLGINILGAFGIAAVVLFILGMIMERFLFRRFRGQMEPSIIIAIGLILLFSDNGRHYLRCRREDHSTVYSGSPENRGSAHSLGQGPVRFCRCRDHIGLVRIH